MRAGLKHLQGREAVYLIAVKKVSGLLGQMKAKVIRLLVKRTGPWMCAVEATICDYEGSV